MLQRVVCHGALQVVVGTACRREEALGPSRGSLSKCLNLVVLTLRRRGYLHPAELREARPGFPALCRQLNGSHDKAGSPWYWRAMRARRGKPSGRLMLVSAGRLWSRAFHHVRMSLGFPSGIVRDAQCVARATDVRARHNIGHAPHQRNADIE